MAIAATAAHTATDAALIEFHLRGLELRRDDPTHHVTVPSSSRFLQCAESRTDKLGSHPYA
jgi:hypothetical protein